MGIVNIRDYNDRREFIDAIKKEISVCSERPTPSRYHKHYGKVYLTKGIVKEFTLYRDILSYIGKNYDKREIEKVEIIFRPAYYGGKPKFIY